MFLNLFIFLAQIQLRPTPYRYILMFTALFFLYLVGNHTSSYPNLYTMYYDIHSKINQKLTYPNRT